MSKKKTKTEWMSPASASEAPSNGPVPPPSLEPATNGPAEPPGEPAFDHTAAPVPDPSPSDVLPPAEGPPASSVVDSPSSEPPPESIDLLLADAPPASEPPVARLAAAPLARAAPDLNVELLLERIRKLEEALGQVPNLQAIDQRVAERVASQLQREKPAAPEGNSFRESASALLGAGKLLLPNFSTPAAAPIPVPVRNASAEAQRVWLVWDTIAEARAIVRMYLDPRYRLSWLGRTLPPILLAAFCTTYYWVPFTTLPMIGWVSSRVVEVLVGFVMFKVLGHEARRYRETAPDLPPSLRL